MRPPGLRRRLQIRRSALASRHSCALRTCRVSACRALARRPNTEPATGHDSPTSILCLQCPSRVRLFRRTHPLTWKTGAGDAQILRRMGLQDHRDELKAAGQRVESIKVSL